MLQAIPEPSSVGLVRVSSPDSITKAIADQQKAGESSSSPLPSLVAYFKTRWEQNKQAKDPIARQMFKNMRRRRAEYEQDEKEAIMEAGGSQGFYQLTGTKCSAAASWILDIMMQPGDKPWGVDPTPLPDLPPSMKEDIRAKVQQALIQEAVAAEVATGAPINVVGLSERIKAEFEAAEADILQQEKDLAKEIAKKMEEVIEDQLTEGGFYDLFPQLVDDLVTLKALIIKGPVVRRKVSRKWKRDQQGGYDMALDTELVKEVDRISPLDYYPAPGSVGVHDGAQIIRHRYSRKELFELIDVPGYDSEAIRRVLRKHRSGGLKEWIWTDAERNTLRQDNNSMSLLDDTKIDTLEMWDCMPGSILEEWGMNGIEDPEAEYEVNCFMVDGEIIRAVLNPDKLGRRPYSKASFLEDPDGFWGWAVPELIEDDQKACNSLYRATINNSSLASGPMVEENVDRRAPGEEGGIYAMKTWETKDEMMTGTPAVRLYNVQFNADKMMNVLKQFAEMADDHSSIPAYAHGNENVGGAGDTASGLSMLMAAASKGIKTVVRNIDKALRDLITRYYDHNMLYHPDKGIKGDLKMVARGSTALIIKEQTTLRLKEFLQMVDGSQNLTAITGREGLEHVLKETAKGMNLEADKVVPERQEVMMQPAQMQPAQMQPQAAQTVDEAGNPVGENNLMQGAV